MVTQELLDYIKQEFDENIPVQTIKQTLLNNGWAEPDVDAALEQVKNPNKTNSIDNQTLSSNHIHSTNMTTGNNILLLIMC